ncbi:MAG: WG repeat-containing protein [Candidatus Magasanikbacteria bacterium]|nr:WG repeat-containing protein [Candidatus Magasanikbacteria bacterium]
MKEQPHGEIPTVAPAESKAPRPGGFLRRQKLFLGAVGLSGAFHGAAYEASQGAPHLRSLGSMVERGWNRFGSKTPDQLKATAQQKMAEALREGKPLTDKGLGINGLELVRTKDGRVEVKEGQESKVEWGRFFLQSEVARGVLSPKEAEEKMDVLQAEAARYQELAKKDANIFRVIQEILNSKGAYHYDQPFLSGGILTSREKKLGKEKEGDCWFREKHHLAFITAVYPELPVKLQVFKRNKKNKFGHRRVVAQIGGIWYSLENTLLPLDPKETDGTVFVPATNYLSAHLDIARRGEAKAGVGYADETPLDSPAPSITDGFEDALLPDGVEPAGSPKDSDVYLPPGGKLPPVTMTYEQAEDRRASAHTIEIEIATSKSSKYRSVKIGERYYFVDNAGKRVSPNFEKVGEFSDGMVAIKSKGKWVFLDENFSQTFFVGGDDEGKNSFDAVGARSFEGMNKVQIGKRWYFFDKRLKGIETFGFRNGFDEIKDFNGGRAAVRNGKKWFFVYRNFMRQAAGEYDWAEAYPDGTAVVEKNGRRFKVDLDENEILSTLHKIGDKYFFINANIVNAADLIGSDGFESIGTPQYLQQGISLVRDKHYNRFLVNENFRIIGGPFFVVSELHDGLAAVLSPDYKWHFFDLAKQRLITRGYEKVWNFRNGLTGAQIDNEWVIINKNDKVLLGGFSELRPDHDNLNYFIGTKNGIRYKINTAGGMPTVEPIK